MRDHPDFENHFDESADDRHGGARHEDDEHSTDIRQDQRLSFRPAVIVILKKVLSFHA